MKRIALIAMLCASPTWAEVGRVVQAENAIIIRGDDTIVAEEGTLVDQGDLLQTTPVGLMHVLLNDETKFVVGPGTAISIDTALIGSDSSTFENLAVGMTAGLFRVITGNSENDAYELNTPAATLGVRGTGYEVCLARQFLLIVNEGIVRTCLRDPVTGEPDLDSCADVEAEEDTCPVIGALETAEGERTIGRANSSAILQCRLVYEEEELGVLDGYKFQNRACISAAEVARQDTQPDEQPPGEDPPEEDPPSEDDETENRVPGRGNGEDEASDTGNRIFSDRQAFSVGGRDNETEASCSKSALLEILSDRIDDYEELIDETTDESVILSYEVALRTLNSIASELDDGSLDGEDCDKLLALLTTPCATPASPVVPEDLCIIAGLNYGFGAGE